MIEYGKITEIAANVRQVAPNCCLPDGLTSRLWDEEGNALSLKVH